MSFFTLFTCYKLSPILNSSKHKNVYMQHWWMEEFAHFFFKQSIHFQFVHWWRIKRGWNGKRAKKLPVYTAFLRILKSSIQFHFVHWWRKGVKIRNERKTLPAYSICSLLGPPRIQHMHKVLILVVLSSVLALLNALLPLIPSLPLQIAGFVLQIIERVCVLVALCSFLTHV